MNLRDGGFLDLKWSGLLSLEGNAKQYAAGKQAKRRTDHWIRIAGSDLVAPTICPVFLRSLFGLLLV